MKLAEDRLLNLTVTSAAGTRSTLSVTPAFGSASADLFDTGTGYEIGDHVRYEGLCYVCIQDTGTPAPVPTNEYYWVYEGDPPPEKYDDYMFGSVDDPPKKYRVIDISLKQDQTCTLGLIEYRPEVYQFEDVAPDINDFPVDPAYVVPPSGLTVREYSYIENATALAAVIISWQKSPDPRGIKTTVVVNGGDYNFNEIETTAAQAIEIKPIKPGTYTFYARSFTNTGKVSAFSSVTKTIFGKITAPSDVETLEIAVTAPTLTLSWKQVPDADVSSYRLKYSPAMSGALWSEATDIGVSFGSSMQVPIRPGTYMIKAVASGNRESTSAREAITNFTDLWWANVVETLTQSPAFPGLPSGVISDENGWIALGQGTTSGTYYMNDPIDLGQVFTARVSMSIVSGARDYLDLMDLWTDIDSRSSWDGGQIDNVNIKTYVRTRDAAIYSWSDWKEFTAGDFRGRYFDFKIVLETVNANTTPLVKSITATVDMPDRIFGENDVISSATGDTEITFTPAFHSLSAVAITANSLAASDYFVITDKSRTGFTINFYDGSDTRVARDFNYMAKGYGYELVPDGTPGEEDVSSVTLGGEPVTFGGENVTWQGE